MEESPELWKHHPELHSLRPGVRYRCRCLFPGAWLTAHSAPSGVKPPHLRVIA